MAGRARLKVAVAQYPIDRLESLDALETKLDRWIGDAAAGGADLVVFPEYGTMEIAGTCGDRVAGSVDASHVAVADTLSDLDRRQAALAGRHAIHILAASGPWRRPDGRIGNAARLITPAGRIGIVEKIIMTPFERNWRIVGGSRPLVFETRLGRIGVLVCYDSEFPLLARAQAEAGAQVILIPACTERISGYHRVRTAALARALENTLATVVAPIVGEAPWSPVVDRNVGAAGVFVPAEAGLSDTGIVIEGVLNEPGLVRAQIDLEQLAHVRANGEMRNSADWGLQPGAGPLPAAEVVDLT